MGELGRKFRQHMVLRGFAEATKESYEHALVDLVRAYDGKSPDLLTNEQIQAHVARLTSERHLAWTTINGRSINVDDQARLCYVALHGDQPMTTMTIRLPERLRDDVQRLGKSEHKAVSDIVRESLRRHVAVQRFRAVRRKVLPFAEAQGLVTDEDVFQALS